MHHDQDVDAHYPHGRGYGNDYMRGGEVLGGYGYANRDEYAKRRGDLKEGDNDSASIETPDERDHIRTGRVPLA